MPDDIAAAYRRTQENMPGIMGSKEIDTQHTPKIVCPYCGHKFRDHTDDDMGRTDCEECDGVFEYTRSVEVTYCTIKMDPRKSCPSCKAPMNELDECGKCGYYAADMED